MNAIGVMPMPADFKYRDVFLQGRPQHEHFDNFSIRHPKMDCGKRAKIFSPFDALRGFNFAISRKEVLYTEKPELCREDERELNRRLEILHNLTFNSRMARQNSVMITATYFVPCQDRQHDAFGMLGQLHTVTGICRRVDPDITQTILVDNQTVGFSNLIKIDSNDPHFLQHEEWMNVYLEECEDV